MGTFPALALIELSVVHSLSVYLANPQVPDFLWHVVQELTVYPHLGSIQRARLLPIFHGKVE